MSLISFNQADPVPTRDPDFPPTLHLCNLANVAYGYCKILDESRADIQLRCHDLLHLMSQPEWDDLELNASDFPEENNFFNNNADLSGYTRPTWFRTPGVLEVFASMSADPKPEDETSTPIIVRRPPWARLVRAALPAKVKDRMKPHWLRGRIVAGAVRSRESATSRLELFRSIEQRFDTLIKHAASFGPEWEITKQELATYHPHAYWLGRQRTHQDAVLAYVLTPIYAMLYGNAPYVPVEIGTMRDIPFDNTPTGRLLALAYRRANHCIITNPDVINAAHRLGLERYSFVPHPLDEDVYAPGEGAFRAELEQRYNADYILFAPARQNWDVKGNDRYLRAFAQLRKRGLRAALLIPGWGQEIERSQKYARELGIGDSVHWIEPQSERKLVKYFSAADFVLDQFVLDVFGLTTPKALSCGAVTITSYSKEVNGWCFDEHPPIVSCKHDHEIANAIWDLTQNPDKRAHISAESRRWVIDNHSKRVIKNKLRSAVELAKDHYAQQQAQRAHETKHEAPPLVGSPG